MDLFLQLLMYGYIVGMFFLMNLFAKKIVQQYKGAPWLKRRFLLPLGLLLVTAIFFLLAAFFPTEIFILFIVPIVSFFVGLIAHISFAKVEIYEQEAAKNSPYTKDKQKSKKQ